ncbi:FAD-dependent oxidoreductase [Leptospira sp. FAT2]|uniref:NAD(P)/FAD-dependent oxidoreductase n=1 Tax=Leptospira sanjuanensis TaxID=2879643 RepID=UPI001EE93038|nr:FAD-dependent oxidoreductase [Leptospira sanjuanensis]MCG6192351.1 FAD-dependent oxidoreductase [Leptospira sanjuanensis]
MKRIVIVGAGVGGIVVARELRKKNRNAEIVMIDRSDVHTFAPSLIWALVGKRSPENFQKKIRPKGVNLISESVQSINWERKIVKTDSKEIHYDFLILSPGSELNPDKIPGFQENAFNLYSLEGVMKAKEQLLSSQFNKVTVMISSTPFKCPAAPYEIALLVRSMFLKQKRKITVEIVTPEEMPMSAGGPEAGIQLVEMLKRNGIEYHNRKTVGRIDSQSKELIFTDGESLKFELLLGVPAHTPPSFLKNSPIVSEIGWVKVNANTLLTSLPNVYAIGDVTSIPLPSGKPLPKAGVFAHAQAEVVASRISDELNHRTPQSIFQGEGSCFLEVGDGKAGFAQGKFYSETGPGVQLRAPSFLWHWGKVLFEKWWLWHWV